MALTGGSFTNSATDSGRTSSNRAQDVPGLRDLLPEEAEAMRITQGAVLAEMGRWGYRYVVTPTLEKVDSLALGLGAEQLRRLFKLTDSDGSVLALVGERTVPVARMAAGKLRSASLPLRLCYAGPVLANDPARFTQRRETHQVGAELIGASGSVADAEVIAMAVRCLDAAGLRDYQVDVGHSEFFQGLLDGLEMPFEAKASVKGALSRRDFVALESILEATSLEGAEHALLLRFPALRGGPEILEAAGSLVRNRRSEGALKELSRVHELLTIHGLGEAVSLDLGAIRDFDYYTGVIFEGYGPDLGRPVAQGGRYDGLLAGFDRPAPATGFMIHLDLVGELLGRAGERPEPARLDAAVAWTQPGLETALRLGAQLRMFGMRAVVDTEPRELASAREWSREQSARHLVHAGEELTVLETGDGRVHRLRPEQVVARIAGSNLPQGSHTDPGPEGGREG